MHRSARSGLLALLALLVLSLPVSAQRGWCSRDPIFSLDDKVGHVYVAVPEGLERLNNSSTDVVIVHPEDVDTDLIWVDPVGFGTGQGISANFKEGSHLQKTAAGYQIEVRVKVPMKDSSVPVRVEFAPDPGTTVTASVEGLANQWVVLKGVILP